MAATLLKHSSAESRSSLSVLLSAVTNSVITDLNCRGESSGLLVTSRMPDSGLVVEALSSVRAATGMCVTEIVP
jgi:hypothetical protein